MVISMAKQFFWLAVESLIQKLKTNWPCIILIYPYFSKVARY